MKEKRKKPAPFHFPAVPLTTITGNRKGKHRKIILSILKDLERLDEYSALQINFIEAGVKKADLRSALHRAAKIRNVDLLTTSDEKHLYVFQRPVGMKSEH
jgi:hypothetical protein